MKPIVNIADIELAPFPAPAPAPLSDKFGCHTGAIGTRIGAQKLGYNVTRVPPGKRAFPLHNHRVNEEMFFILEGEGEVRIGKDRHPVKQGDFIACPPGSADTAHQLINTGTTDLKYLAVSTRISPEVVDYPDSGKFGVAIEGFRFLGRPDGSLGYWDGE